MSEFTIRPVTEGDVPFLWDMLYESIHTPEGAQLPAKDIVHHPSLSKYVDHWGREGDAGFVAIDASGQPIGSVTIRLFPEADKGYGFVDEETPELGTAILKEYRGKGIGTALMRTMMEEAKHRGIQAISLSVDPGNPAVRLYRRFGFREIGMEGTSVTMKADI
jgi:ribosomal protein S18 acetylase RimI-like enzyme